MGGSAARADEASEEGLNSKHALFEVVVAHGGSCNECPDALTRARRSGSRENAGATVREAAEVGEELESRGSLSRGA